MIQLTATIVFPDEIGLQANGHATELLETPTVSVALLANSRSVTAERLLAFYKQDSANFPTLLSGEYAYIIADRAARTVQFGVDAFATKPLFYALIGNQLELDTDLASLVQRLPQLHLNRTVFAQLFDANTVDLPIADATYYEEIKRVLPDQRLVWHEGKLTARQTPLPENRLTTNELPEAAASFRKLLQDAIEERVKPNERVGANLSGGLDSSTLVSFYAASARPNAGVDTYYLDTAAEGAKETHYAHLVVKKWQTKHRELAFEVPDYEQIKGIVKQLGQPDFLLFSSASHQAIISAARQQGNTLLLSGHGGDQVVGYGFDYLKELIRQKRWAALRDAIASYDDLRNASPSLLERQVKGLLKRLLTEKKWVEAGNWLYVSVVHLGFRWWEARWPQRSSRAYSWSKILLPSLKVNLSKTPAAPKATTSRQSMLNSMYIKLGIISAETLSTLAHQANLTYSFPFFDRNLLAFSLELPEEWRFGQGYLRGVLREAIRDIVPDEIRLRVSKGEFSGINLQHFQALYPMFRQQTPDSSKLWQLLDKDEVGRLAATILNEETPMPQRDNLALLGIRIIYTACWLEQVGHKLEIDSASESTR